MAADIGTATELANGGSYTADAGSDRLVVVALIANGGTPPAAPTGMTLGGNALTQAVYEVDNSGATAAYHEGLFYIKEADIQAGAQALAWTWASTPATHDRAVVFTATDADQTTPIGSTSPYTNDATTVITSGSLTVANGDMVIGSANVTKTSTSMTDPVGYTNAFSANSATYNYKDLSIIKKAITSGGTEAPEYALSASTGGVGVFAVIKVAAAAGVTITNVDTDNIIQNKQQNVVTTVTGAGATQGTGSKVLTSGAITSAFTIDTWADTSIQGDPVQGNIPFTTASHAVFVKVTNDSASTDSLEIEYNPEDDTAVIELLNPTEGDGQVDITGTPATADLYHHDDILYLEDGTTPTAYTVSIDATGKYSFSGPPAGTYKFKVRHWNQADWDVSDISLGTVQTVIITEAAAVSSGGHMKLSRGMILAAVWT